MFIVTAPGRNSQKFDADSLVSRNLRSGLWLYWVDSRYESVIRTKKELASH